MQRLSTQAALRQLINNEACGTQADVQNGLADMGIEITQASVSRALQRIGAIKRRRPDGSIAYQIPNRTVEPAREKLVHEMVDEIIQTDSMIIIQTKPDSAKFITQFIDDAHIEGIAGTIAGEYTIFIAPYATNELPTLFKQLNDLLL